MGMSQEDWLRVALAELDSSPDNKTFSAPWVKALVDALVEHLAEENLQRAIPGLGNAPAGSVPQAERRLSGAERPERKTRPFNSPPIRERKRDQE